MQIQNISTETAKGILRSYSQIFFSDNYKYAIILLFVSFFDIVAGTCGLISVIVAFIASRLLGFDTYSLEKGLFGFNNILVGLAIGLQFSLSWELILLTATASLLTLFIGISLQGIFYKYNLPILSIPFLLVAWLIALSNNTFAELGLSTRGIYIQNEMYALGGESLYKLHLFFSDINLPKSLNIYFLSLGAIFFQSTAFAGILIAFVILAFSRISFSLSLIGFYTAYLFYNALGIDIESFHYSYIGFNYILTSIAIGGYFFIPSLSSYILTICILPLVVLISMGSSKLLSHFALPAFALPFNMSVIIVIYALKLRVTKHDKLVETNIQLNQPEKNIYFTKNQHNKLLHSYYFPVSLPFMGEWTVSQAHNGEITHKNEWQHAWDFIITDKDDNQFKNNGDLVTDYFCYGKSVVAPADGYIVEIVNDIEDNKIGYTNMHQNWGNSVVIKHSEYLYSQISHLKKDSITVKTGDFIKHGTQLGVCGNSGNSPYPHVHFQFQATPHIGSHTIEYPFDQYILNTNSLPEILNFSIPNKNNKVSNSSSTKLLNSVFEFVAGTTINFEITTNNTVEEVQYECLSNVYKQHYLYCKKTNSFAYYTKTKQQMFFTQFEGDKSSFLFVFYLVFNTVNLQFIKELEIKNQLPLYQTFKQHQLFVQDFVAPFYLFMKSEFSLKYIKADNSFSPMEILLEQNITNKSLFRTKKYISSSILISNNTISQINIQYKNKDYKVQCVQ